MPGTIPNIRLLDHLVGAQQQRLRQRSTQPIEGAASLTTDTLNIDWTKSFGQQLTMKAYVKVNRRNHGDPLLQVDERIIGVQGAFKW